MKISIITVCKNSEKLIETAIQSVVEQTYQNIEYIIIDGASEDRTIEIIKRYQDRIDYFVSESDGGIYPAMNKGIKAATGDFVYFLNSDDYLIDQNIIQDVVSFIQDHADGDLVYGDLDARDLNHNYVFSIVHPHPQELMERMIWGWIYHQGTFARRELFDRFGLFNEKYRISADHDWLYKVLESDAKLYYFPRKIASYWLGGVSAVPEQQAAALTEIFAVQNQVYTYQQPDWLNKRIEKFQSVIIELNTELQNTRKMYQELQQQNRLERLMHWVSKIARKVKTKIANLR